jgi:hypothetical protein
MNQKIISQGIFLLVFSIAIMGFFVQGAKADTVVWDQETANSTSYDSGGN